MTAIDGYIDELGAALRGPRRAKADLLAEARDSLVDAVDAYQSRGLSRETAEREAVDEFGAVREVAPGYQAELGLAQGRRTALLIFLVLAAQDPLWDAWLSMTAAGAAAPRPGLALVDGAVKWLGGLAMAGALLVALAGGIGVRYLGVRRGLTRGVGVLAFAVCGVFAVSGPLLAVLSLDGRLSLSVAGPLLVFLLLPLTWTAVSGRRCLAAAA